MLASSALDAEFLLGAPERCPLRKGVMDNCGSRAWGPPLHSLPFPKKLYCHSLPAIAAQ